jgi:hypothetical protein
MPAQTTNPFLLEDVSGTRAADKAPIAGQSDWRPGGCEGAAAARGSLAVYPNRKDLTWPPR